MMGVLTELPTRVLEMMSKSVSVGAAELQTGTLMWTRPGNFSLRPSMASERLLSSLTSTSDCFLLTSTTLSLLPSASSLCLTVSRNSSSPFLTMSLVIPPSSAYSPILLGGLAQMGWPLT